ncbi:MAG: helix-turn-helix domain-containing protein [Oscillospiraceae bacterium]|nr:helix-turn-helix domain-containing protein [Oscillospiraceae bacterium]
MNESTSVFSEYPDIVTPNDLMKMLRIGRNAAYSLLQNNTIPSFRVGKRYKISKQSVIEYISQ